MHRKNFQDLCQCFDVVANLGPVGKMGPPFSVAGFIVLLEGGTTTISDCCCCEEVFSVCCSFQCLQQNIVVTRRSWSFTSPVSGLNVLADWRILVCSQLCGYLTEPQSHVFPILYSVSSHD